MQSKVRKPSVLDRVFGAYLAFKTDLTEWDTYGSCPTCGATMYRKDDGEQYELRCLNCGTHGTGS